MANKFLFGFGIIVIGRKWTTMISTYKPQCYNAFYSTRCCQPKAEKETAPLGVKLAAFVGSAATSCFAAYAIAKSQNTIKGAKTNLFKVKYREPQILAVATASVVGGLLAGILSDDKKHIPAKIKEGTHQFIANILSPLIIVGVLQAGYSKIADKIKIPQIASTKTSAKVLNYVIKTLPGLVITLAGLISGVFLGTHISNKINGTANTDKARKVKIWDFKYHPDDVATALALSDKSPKTQAFIGKVIPPIFTLSGYETGVKR